MEEFLSVPVPERGIDFKPEGITYFLNPACLILGFNSTYGYPVYINFLEGKSQVIQFKFFNSTGLLLNQRNFAGFRNQFYHVEVDGVVHIRVVPCGNNINEVGDLMSLFKGLVDGKNRILATGD